MFLSFYFLEPVADVKHEQHYDSEAEDQHEYDDHVTREHPLDMLQLTPCPCIACHALAHHLVLSWGNHCNTASTSIETVCCTTGRVDSPVDIQRAAHV